jgi:hypothetical protein
MRYRTSLLPALATLATMAAIFVIPAGARADTPPPRMTPGRIALSTLSSGARTWFQGLQPGSERPDATRRVAFGSNVDANDPQQDLGAGQSETAIAASGRTLLAAWNDISGSLVAPSTDVRASITGVGLSTNGGRSFRDLIGLRNDSPNQQWFGDPTAVAIDAHHFAVGSIYLPSAHPDCAAAPAQFEVAVEIVTVASDGSASFGAPVVVASGGDACPLLGQDPGGQPAPDLALLDKEWLSYDSQSRTLATSFTRFFFGFGGQSGTGQVELTRATVPADPATLTGSSWHQPVVVWPEEPVEVNTGAYVAVAPGGDAYLAWERNVQSNLNDGDPYVYIHAALVRAGDTAPVVGGPAAARVVSTGQRNASPTGGVKSMDAVVIPGYSRGIGQDFPRIAVDAPKHKVVVVWNDASAHPLGDIWLRGLPLDLTISGPISKVNDDDSFALHFLPAVSVRTDGSIATSWYDRRIGGPTSVDTEYFAEIRTSPTKPGRDFRITTAATNWSNTGSLINPNFGDYTDNASSGTTTYFTWSDGRIGVPQPFVDHR